MPVPAPSSTLPGRARLPGRFRIIDETSAYIVVEKSPHLLIHPSKPDGQPTLWGELRGLLAFELVNGGQISIINRLDRETSGLVLVAKTPAAAREFGLMMQAKLLAKEYLALVWGWPEWERQTVDAPLARQGDHEPSAIYLKQTIHGQGRSAVTEFRVEKRFQRETLGGDKFSVVRAVPITGRMHQIRVHLASLGHAVVGDKIYGPDEQHYLRFIETGWTPELESALLLPRHALHSARLRAAEVGDWESALPADLDAWIDSNRAGHDPAPPRRFSRDCR